VVDNGPGTDLSLGSARSYRIGCRVLSLVAPLVPASRRDEWRREWEAELWHYVALRGGGVDRTTMLDLAWRVAGALPHALWIRRDEWRLDMITQDLAYALRSTLKRPGFALLVVGTLGLGIGANTAMFTIVNSVLIQPLPYERPEDLVYINGAFDKGNQASISPLDFRDYRAANQVFTSLAARVGGGMAVLTGGGDPERVSASVVSANFFSTLGIAPLRGRTFLPDEEQGDGHPVVILAYGLWQRRFAGDPALVGKTITINARPAQVVGIMPPVLDRTIDTQVWQPLEFGTPGYSVRRFHFLRGVGRLKPGITLGQAQASMDVVAKHLAEVYPENATWKLRMRPYREVVIGDAKTALLILFGAVGLVLLIACGNVASLLLARSTSRRGEIAIRTALGASRTRLIRQLLTESLLLAAAAGVVGLALAVALIRGVRLVGEGILPRLAEIGIDRTVLAFAIALSLGTGLVFGLAPALHAARADLVASFSSLTRGSAGRRTVRMRDALVAAQVALSLVLLVGAGLLVRSLWQLQRVEPGFEANGVLTAQLLLPGLRYGDSTTQLRFWNELTDRARATPGVIDASITTMLPLAGGGDTYYWLDGPRPTSAADTRTAHVNVVADRYFETMRVPMVAGRSFSAPDQAGGPNAMIISESMAKKLFRGQSAVGKRLVVDFGEPFRAEIVGVAGDVHAFGLDVDAPDIMYFTYRQTDNRARLNVVLRTKGDPLSLTPTLRGIVGSIDRDLPLANVRTMQDIVDGSTSRARFGTRLLGGFAATALLLAIVGLYGVLAYAVTQRTRELGIRIALGAQHSQVFGLVVRRGMAIVGTGIVIGLAGAFAATRLVEGLLFQVGRTDPLVFLAVSAVLAAAGLVACLVPARRATRVDPLAALRVDQ
jgi:putative ABC transport system permease protein